MYAPFLQAVAEATAAAGRERAVMERRAQREAEEVESQRRLAERACEALQRALVQVYIIYKSIELYIHI